MISPVFDSLIIYCLIEVFVSIFFFEVTGISSSLSKLVFFFFVVARLRTIVGFDSLKATASMPPIIGLAGALLIFATFRAVGLAFLLSTASKSNFF